MAEPNDQALDQVGAERLAQRIRTEHPDGVTVAAGAGRPVVRVDTDGGRWTIASEAEWAASREQIMGDRLIEKRILRAFRTGAGAFWFALWAARPLVTVLLVPTVFLLPVVVLIVNDQHPSGLLYLALTAAVGLVSWALMARFALREPAARQYAREHPWRSVIPSAALVAGISSSLQFATLGITFGDTGPQTLIAAGTSGALLLAFGLVVARVRRAEAPVRRT